VKADFGAGPGEITADGCAVELYALLPATGEPELVHGQLAEGDSVLDLGAGVGRVADPLVQLGHRIVAVDDSLDMLDRVCQATTIHSNIEELRLQDRFDAALLASFLINTADAGQRQAFLATARYQLTVEDLDSELAASGLRFDRFLTEDRTWFRAATQDKPSRRAVAGR
jgi:SAM-dependent methyltransferase